jgi:hypothetical protein
MAGTSLAYKGTSVREKRVCPRVDFDLMDELSGLIVSGSCKAYICPVCGPAKAKTWVGAAALYGRPERFLRLSLIPEEFQRARGQVKNLGDRIRRAGYRNEWLWVIEPNPKGTGYHLHALQHGDFIPQATLQDMCGGRIPDIRKVLGGGGSVSAYAMKGFGVGGYAMKGFGGSFDKFKNHLELNGGRPCHYSRGFFRDASGGKMKATDARKSFLEALDDGEERRWVRIPRASAQSERR